MHIYLDASGDTGFKFGEGFSGYFVVALVLVPDVADAEDAVRVLRAALNEPEGYEFKFARMPHHLRVAVLRGRDVGIGVSAHVLVVNKRRLISPELRERDTCYIDLMRTALPTGISCCKWSTWWRARSLTPTSTRTRPSGPLSKGCSRCRSSPEDKAMPSARARGPFYEVLSPQPGMPLHETIRAADCVRMFSHCG